MKNIIFHPPPTQWGVKQNLIYLWHNIKIITEVFALNYVTQIVYSINNMRQRDDGMKTTKTEKKVSFFLYKIMFLYP